jgi:hypothetical protein
MLWWLCRIHTDASDTGSFILAMSSSAASTSKPTDSSTKGNEQKEEDAQPTLGVLEEDDEFEEFPVAG